MKTKNINSRPFRNYLIQKYFLKQHLWKFSAKIVKYVLDLFFMQVLQFI